MTLSYLKKEGRKKNRKGNRKAITQRLEYVLCKYGVCALQVRSQ